jgi:2-methylcitrate dehydratase PrpD
LERKAGIPQFVDKKVRERKVIDLMKRVALYVDDEMESLGYDQVRSKIRVKLKNGTIIEGRADVARGHPQKPLSWAELGEKFRDCAALALPRENAEAVIRLVDRLADLRSLAPLLRALGSGQEARAKKARRHKGGSKKWNRTRKP